MPDLIDRASEYEEHHRAAALQAHEERRRREQAAQLAPGPARRVCVDCGDVIPALRLAALPLTTRCTSCQARQEAG